MSQETENLIKDLRDMLNTHFEYKGRVVHNYAGSDDIRGFLQDTLNDFEETATMLRKIITSAEVKINDILVAYESIIEDVKDLNLCSDFSKNCPLMGNDDPDEGISNIIDQLYGVTDALEL